MPAQAGHLDERSPLLQHDNEDLQAKTVDFSPFDPENPRNWSPFRKYSNMTVIALMALVSPLASASFNPAIPRIAEDFHTSRTAVIGSTTGFLFFLGIGPLVLAPLSETFGRRRLYLVCFSIFGLFQIPCALSTNVQSLIAFRATSAFFGSVGIANGGGTVSDMFEPSKRAGVYGYYLLGPLLGPAIGPTLGGIIMEYTNHWPWIFYTLSIICAINTLAGFVFLKESYAPSILAKRKRKYEAENGRKISYMGEDTRPLRARLAHSMKRPLKILFLQPIVFVMAGHQAIIYGIMYTLYTQIPGIFSSSLYHFTTLQIGLLYLFPGCGSLLAVAFLVPYIDTVFNKLTKRNNGIAQPEFRLPLANVGSVLIPASLLWFGWSASNGLHWAAVITSLPFFTIGEELMFSSVQNYYIDAFEQYSASAIAAGALFRDIIGGIVPVVMPGVLHHWGYGWSFTILAVLASILAPAPIVFYYYGRRVREHFVIDL